MAIEGNLNLKQIIDFLRLSQPSCEPIFYRKWTKIDDEGDGESAFRKDDFKCKLLWENVKLHEIDAQQFLAFAKRDLNEDSERGRINALSNAKRAINCRVDELLTLFNFKGFAAQQRWNLPSKINVLRSFGVLTPDILKRLIVSPRNVLEHKYISPKEQGARDAVDLAELFLQATRLYVEKGFIVSATVTYTSYFKGFEKWGMLEEYELRFNLEDEKLTLKYSEKELWWEPNSETGEPDVVDLAQLGEEKEPVTISIHDCKMEDIRELMALLREKGKVE